MYSHVLNTPAAGGENGGEEQSLTGIFAWASEQAALLRRQMTEADIENIAEEIETMGRSENGSWSAASCCCCTC
jgi:hypothetical protein